MGRVKSLGHAKRFLTTHDQINTIFRPCRYRLTATSYRLSDPMPSTYGTVYTFEMTI